MRNNIFFASDHHFGHENCYSKFTREDGSFLRHDLATSAAEGDELMIQRHNAVVKPNDRVYFLGDVAISKHYIHLVGRMNGKKVLVKGNHDIFDLALYTPYFEDIRSVVSNRTGFIGSHIPLHPESLSRWGFNIHGHLHANRVQKYFAVGETVIDPRYFCVSVEQINYTPISLDEVLKFKP